MEFPGIDLVRAPPPGNSQRMRLLYVTFIISEGIADRGEVSYDTWNEWVAED